MPGDYVYYHNCAGDTIPTKVLAVRTIQVKVAQSTIAGHGSAWVSARKCEFQKLPNERPVS
jgi:hypothetical protein